MDYKVVTDTEPAFFYVGMGLDGPVMVEESPASALAMDRQEAERIAQLLRDRGMKVVVYA